MNQLNKYIRAERDVAEEDHLLSHAVIAQTIDYKTHAFC